MKRYTELEEKFKLIVSNMEYPETMSDAAKNLIQRLIVIDPKKRLGHDGAEEIKNHPFFATLNWEKMKKKHITPPFVPSVFILI